MAQFAGYGFNKSHSAAYALLAYHTAYLKTHYPVEFMAALLTSVTGSTDDVVKYINECREMGIAVEAPDINVSDANFTPHGESIRFGLAAVKNVGGNAIESIVAARKKLGRFKSIFEFCENVDLRLLNKRVLESLIKSGAMDSHGPPRAAHGRARQSDGAGAESAARRRIRPARPVWRVSAGRRRIAQRQTAQHSRLGRAHPPHRRKRNSRLLHQRPSPAEIQRQAADLRALSIEEIAAMTKSTGKDETIVTAGIIGNVRVLKSKRGDFYAQATLEDMSGSIDMIVFPEAYKRIGEKVKLEVPVLVKAGVRIEEGANPKITAAEIQPLEEAKVPLPRAIRIRIPLENSAGNHRRRSAHALPRAQRRSQSVV